MKKRFAFALLLGGVALIGCSGPLKGSFGDDVAFLKKHTDVVVLGEPNGSAQVAVVPLYQGRVMTSTATGPDGISFGWINRKVIADGTRQPHINVFGGEERMWLGPEGGQFSIFFAKGTSDKFDFKDWQTPEPIDWGGWNLAEKTATSARFTKNFSLENFSGTKFDVAAERTVRLLANEDIKKQFGVEVPATVKAVAFETDNNIKNAGSNAWDKATGTLSIWILCMFNPSPATTIVVPYVQGPDDKLGPVVNDAYFGKIAANRLVAKDGIIYFKADGQKRGKIGLNPMRAKTLLGSYDAANKVLTLANYTKAEGVTDYVNSMWEIQKEPFKGDVANSYNDGPTPAGPPLGPFYELESSSPAGFLKPGESLKHIHRTLHLQGPMADLEKIAKATLGVRLVDITNALE